MTAVESVQTTCCIAGGGPAGVMLGYLLARAGIDVVVLEKHADFLRDFRGDTIHPSTLQVMKELGLLEELLQRPHQKVHQLTGIVGAAEYTIADFSHLPVVAPYIALMPQWDFLNFLAEKARAFPSFHLRTQTEATDIIVKDGVVTGVKANGPHGPVEISATLTIGADGRHSTLRKKAGLVVEELGTPIDVLWMRLSRKASDPAQPLGRLDRGKVFVMLYRDTYWQCAYVIPKGGYERIRERGLEAFRADIIDVAPAMQDRVQELQSWDDIKLLTVTVDRLKQWWRPGLLCIGDAAHAMSPIGGIGINLAIQDTVATANIITGALREKRLTVKELRAVQKRREWPTRITQNLQVFVQNRILGRVVTGGEKLSPPWIVRWLLRQHFTRRIPARIVGMGFRPEHADTKYFS